MPPFRSHAEATGPSLIQRRFSVIVSPALHGLLAQTNPSILDLDRWCGSISRAPENRDDDGTAQEQNYRTIFRPSLSIEDVKIMNADRPVEGLPESIRHVHDEDGSNENQFGPVWYRCSAPLMS